MPGVRRFISLANKKLFAGGDTNASRHISKTCRSQFSYPT